MLGGAGPLSCVHGDLKRWQCAVQFPVGRYGFHYQIVVCGVVCFHHAPRQVQFIFLDQIVKAGQIGVLGHGALAFKGFIEL
jgi:hypothetical protein